MENPLTKSGLRPLNVGTSSHSARTGAENSWGTREFCDWHAIAKARLDSLTKPLGSLGRLEEFAARMVCISEQERPNCADKTVYVFAADHGVTEEGVSAYPKAVTQQMVRNFVAGGAAINVLARRAGAEVVVVDVGVDADFDSYPGLVHKKVRRGTRNMALGPAMTESEVNAALEVGRALTWEDQFQKSDLIAVGEMGIGSTTAASAIAAELSRKPVGQVTGTGTGISCQALIHKQKVIEKALEVNGLNHSSSPFDILKKVGGLEIAAMAGMILAASEQSVPVVIDGFISTAAAALAFALEPRVKGMLFAGHLSEEPGHRVLLDYIGLEPILNLRMRLGEGTGAVLAMMVIDAAVSILNEMATFQSAGVSKANP
jgi:nicotinate-nucleotide--dimethylbenzimidazole phosphoribosyltransferase